MTYTVILNELTYDSPSKTEIIAVTSQYELAELIKNTCIYLVMNKASDYANTTYEVEVKESFLIANSHQHSVDNVDVTFCNVNETLLAFALPVQLEDHWLNSELQKYEVYFKTAVHRDNTMRLVNKCLSQLVTSSTLAHGLSKRRDTIVKLIQDTVLTVKLRSD